MGCFMVGSEFGNSANWCSLLKVPCKSNHKTPSNSPLSLFVQTAVNMVEERLIPLWNTWPHIQYNSFNMNYHWIPCKIWKVYFHPLILWSFLYSWAAFIPQKQKLYTHLPLIHLLLTMFLFQHFSTLFIFKHHLCSQF